MGAHWASLCLILVLGAGLAFAAGSHTGRIGPKNRIQPNGRKVHPAGNLTKLGNHPNGGALTRNGRYLWTLSAGRGINDIRIVRVKGRHRGRVVQKIVMPGMSGGIAMDPRRNRVYVSGLPASPHADETPPPSVPGQGGDVIHVFKYRSKTGRAKRHGIIGVPPPSSAPAYQDFPPQTAKESWPQEIAISPNGRTLLVALNLADSAAIVNTKTKAVSYATVGHYPYGAAIDRKGHGYVTSETQGKVSEIDLASGNVIRDIQVGPHLSHPEGMAVDPKGKRLYVAVTAQDLIAVVDTKTGGVIRTLSVARPQGNGSAPIRVSVSDDGCHLLSADSGEDAIAVFAIPNGKGHTCREAGGKHPVPWKLVGRVPTAAYPVAAQASHRRLVWVTAKGLGVGPNPNGPNPNAPEDSDDNINTYQYLPSIVRGESGILRFPGPRRLAHLTPKADRELVPLDSRRPPKGTPIRPNGPIQHVFYVVKENRTYDQIMGDDKRGDGDRNLTLFGKHVTPNMHALARRFPLLDHVYADSEASIDGHYWTAAGAVSDYVIRNWHQNYAGRGRPYDFGSYEVSAPPTGYIFERMLNAGISFFNYGEALAGLSPFPDKDKTNAEQQTALQILASSDVGLLVGTPPPLPNVCYDSDLSNSTVLSMGTVQVYDSSLPPGAPAGSHSRFDCFKARFQLQDATQSVPTFNYLVLPNDHTEGTHPGRRTPTAQIASNDWAVGQIVQLISHSDIWEHSLIIVQEDDSQDGADHVDAHRIPALAISPYARRGAVVHTRYDQLSLLRTAELVMGLRPTNLAEALSVPLYNAFSAKPKNAAGYSAIVPNVDMTAQNTAKTPGAKLSSGLNLSTLDQVSQSTLDRILWKYVHGARAKAPPPGPNASTSDADPGENIPLPRVRQGYQRNLKALRAAYRQHSRDR
jgi:phosphoesterase family protein/lactonase family protein with 7-bladed beta-propeller